MHPERWRRIKEVLDVSLRLARGERAEYLTRVCEGDEELRDEVESLIEAYEEAGDMMETPAPAPPRDPLLGSMLGPYRILDVLGSGGMGSVYRAERADDAFEKEVAIKVVRLGLDRDFMVRHFRMERQIMASLEHPHIARLLDGGATPDGAPYFVMEFIRGVPVDRYCAERRLGVRERLELFETICGAVGFAHGLGVVHRDIKPGNILVTADGAPKLLDFGIAKIVNPEHLPGARESLITAAQAMTPEYASPEQLRHGNVTEASDVYSLGVLLCEIVTGKRLHGGNVPPGLPRDIEMIVRMATREEPERRYESASAFGEDVRRYLDGLPVRARKGALGYRASKFLRRQRSVALAVAAGLAAPALVYVAIELRDKWRESSAPMQIVTLTSAPGREFQPSFSPDGKRVVYSASGETGENTDIYVQAIGAPQPFRLTTDRADDLSPVWSPDGSRIAWLRTGPKETAIFVSPAGGGVHGKVADVFPTRVESVGRQLDWAPDGKLLAASDKEAPGLPFRIVLIDVATGRKRQATMPPENIIGDMAPCFSPDGKWLAFIRAVSSGIGDVWIAPVAGGEPRRVTVDNRSILAITWGPEGRSIVFSSNRKRNHALWRIPVSGGAPSRVPMVSENASDPAFSRDGRRMVYAQIFEDTNIWRFDLDRRQPPRKVVSSTQYDSSPTISPDGARIAFRSNRSGSNEIWQSDSNGRLPSQLTHVGGALTGSPKWSPDGKWIAFDSRPDGQADIYVMPAEGGDMRRISNSPAEDVVPNWSRDGQWIYFASIRSGAWQVWRARASGGGPEEQVTRLGGFAAVESVDGKYLYYAKGRSAEGLWRKRLPDGDEAPFIPELKTGFWGYWALAAKGAYFLDWPGPGKPASIWWQAFEGHRVQVGSVDGPPVVSDSGFVLSPDGRYLLYSQMDQSGSDILVLEHYRD